MPAPERAVHGRAAAPGRQVDSLRAYVEAFWVHRLPAGHERLHAAAAAARTALGRLIAFCTQSDDPARRRPPPPSLCCVALETLSGSLSGGRARRPPSATP